MATKLPTVTPAVLLISPASINIPDTVDLLIVIRPPVLLNTFLFLSPNEPTPDVEPILMAAIFVNVPLSLYIPEFAEPLTVIVPALLLNIERFRIP